MADSPVCQRCGAPLPGDAPEGLCPKCLLMHSISTTGDPNGPAEAPVSPGPATAPSPAELAPLFPQLEILELLGQGGMGAVYKARQPALNRLVALKILPPQAKRDPSFAERFAREARALGQLNHPNIVTVYDSGRADGLYYLLMEYVDGVNLRQLLRAGHVEPREALKIVPQICDALQYAHDEGIVHRDIKPENILLDKKGRVKIADFGIAKMLGAKPAEYTLTGPWQLVGTVHYMAPEQMEKPLQVDHRADIYSLGVVFYELLTGQLPLGHFPPPSKKVEIDVRLDEVVLRTLASEPERRYQRAGDVKTDIQRYVAPTVVLSPAVIRALGFEYRSQRTLFGLPLVHVAFGIDPTTGRQRVAKGIIAVGNMAIGWVAMGGLAMGGIAFGGLSVGILALGGLGLGLIAMAGMSIGLLLALGGCAAGGVAVAGVAAGFIAYGGVAYGYYAMGGEASGVHAWGRNIHDPIAKEFFDPWLKARLEELGGVMTSGAFLVVIFLALAVLLTIQARMRQKIDPGFSTTEK